MAGSEKYIKIAKAGANEFVTSAANTPAQYVSRQRQYMAGRTRLFANKRAYLSTDFVNADVQGLDLSDFYKYINVNIRLADIVNGTATGKNTDDFKNILFPDLFIDYFPIGAKVITMGNTWILINASNISDVNASGIVGRCNSSYNSFDYYGNVVTEPIIVEKYAMMGNDNENPRNMVLMDGHFNVTCQKNAVTSKLGHNKRIIMGTQAYFITGFSDFIQEFSGDRESVHLIKFTARIDEVTKNDDMVNFVADGAADTFSVSVYAPNELTEGETAKATASFIKNGDVVTDTEEKPVSFVWESSDENVFTVSGDGTVTATGVGTAILTARLSQNLALVASAGISVRQADTQSRVEFTGFIPNAIKQYDTANISASFYEDGVSTDYPLQWSFAGGENCYSAIISDDGKSVEITCLNASKEKLGITAEYGDHSETIYVGLEGY